MISLLLVGMIFVFIYALGLCISLNCIAYQTFLCLVFCMIPIMEIIVYSGVKKKKKKQETKKEYLMKLIELLIFEAGAMYLSALILLYLVGHNIVLTISPIDLSGFVIVTFMTIYYITTVSTQMYRFDKELDNIRYKKIQEFSKRYSVYSATYFKVMLCLLLLNGINIFTTKIPNRYYIVTALITFLVFFLNHYLFVRKFRKVVCEKIEKKFGAKNKESEDDKSEDEESEEVAEDDESREDSRTTDVDTL